MTRPIRRVRIYDDGEPHSYIASFSFHRMTGQPTSGTSFNPLFIKMKVKEYYFQHTTPDVSFHLRNRLLCMNISCSVASPHRGNKCYSFRYKALGSVLGTIMFCVLVFSHNESLGQKSA